MTKNVAKKVLISENAPKAIGPYSQGISVGGFVFLSGQLGIDSQSGALVDGGIEAQTEQALINLRHVLESCGLNLEHVIKTTVFLKDIKDFSKMNMVYAKYFPTEPPARSTIQVAALPKDGLVEIEAIVILSE